MSGAERWPVRVLLGCSVQCIIRLKSALRLQTSSGVAEATKEAAIATKILQRQTELFGGVPSGRQRRARFLPRELEISSCLGRFYARCEEQPCLNASGFSARFEHFEGYRARGLVLTIESRSHSEQAGSECM